MKLTSETVAQAIADRGDDVFFALQVVSGTGGLVPVTTDLNAIDFSMGRYVQIEPVRRNDDETIECVLLEDGIDLYETTEPKDWPTVPSFWVQKVGFAHPGYTSGGEYIDTIEQVLEYIKGWGIVGADDSEQWFGVIYEDVG